MDDLPFFIRWFVHYDGIQGNKARGVEAEQLLQGLTHDFPENPLFERELALVQRRPRGR